MNSWSALLARYDAEVRASPVSTPGLRVVRDADVVRLEGAYNYVSYWNFSGSRARAAVREQASHFRQIGEKLIWRVYGHDEPTNLGECLRQEGFMPCSPGTLMVLPLAGCTTTPRASHDIRRVTSTAGLRDYLAVASAAFGSVDAGQLEYFSELLASPQFSLFVGYENNLPVAAGRIETPSGTCFALLFGGGVAPRHRGRGFYRDLVDVRIRVAKERGCDFATTEAQETSRPILEKLGFLSLTSETTWWLQESVS